MLALVLQGKLNPFLDIVRFQWGNASKRVRLVGFSVFIRYYFISVFSFYRDDLHMTFVLNQFK